MTLAYAIVMRDLHQKCQMYYDEAPSAFNCSADCPVYERR